MKYYAGCGGAFPAFFGCVGGESLSHSNDRNFEDIRGFCFWFLVYGSHTGIDWSDVTRITRLRIFFAFVFHFEARGGGAFNCDSYHEERNRDDGTSAYFLISVAQQLRIHLTPQVPSCTETAATHVILIFTRT